MTQQETVHESRWPFGHITRFRLRNLFWLVVAGLLVYLLLSQFGHLQQTLEVLQDVRWEWFVAGVAISTLIHVLGALSQLGAIEQSLSLRQMTLAQLAAGFANRFGPPGVGSAVVMTRYLEQHGLERPAAFGAVAVKTAAGSVVHVLLLVGVVMLIDDIDLAQVSRLPAGWTVLVLAAVALALLGIILWTPLGRHRLVRSGLQHATQLATAVRHPRRAFQLFGGAAGGILISSLTLLVSLYAFDTQSSLLHASAVYLGGMTIGTFSPTPGGLGGVEAGLVAGLTFLGVEPGPAIAGVLLFRLHTFWLPIVPGFIAFRYLRRQQHL